MRDKTLYELFECFINEIYPLIDPIIEQKWIKPKYDNYPTLNYKENGMPNLSSSSLNSPFNISDLFRSWSGNPDINLKGYECYNSLINYLIEHNEYKSTTYPVNISDQKIADDHYSLITQLNVENILERYYLLNRDKNNSEILEIIYTEWENYIYAENLNFDISIPILFLTFTDNEYIINEDFVIRKISDDYHKARFYVRSYTPPVIDPIIESATHEIVFKNYHIKKDKNIFWDNLSNEDAYPLLKFETFFNALKIVTNHNSGFSQILVYPHNWTDYYSKDLPRLKGISVKKYPNYFENYYWNNPIPVIDNNEIGRIASVFVNLLNNTNSKIQISSRRLRSSYLRDNEEDSILDIIIALETLLSDNDKGEIAHKLSLRIAKLISVYNKNYNSSQVFSTMKKIYNFRSAIVHGSNKVDSKKEIKLHDEAKPIRTISIANDYLREVIRILIENPKFLNAEEIDQLLLQ
jgi:hypothetical protein